ncbi:hypothetical protein [Pseudomonas urmiensis]|uniref:hypothetical protein n=1 Tax=Pseudomonas urmiensis TaxID=2745493 RepID=UPI003D13A30B
MTEVHRYKAVQLVSMGGSHIGYDPHGPEVVMASAYDELRAQLAKRDALLREVLEAFQLESDGSCINPGRDFIRPWAAKVSALSASAEPTVPTCGHAACKSLGEPHLFCDFVRSLEPSAPAERDERADFEKYYVDWFNRKYNPTDPLTVESMAAARRGDHYGAGSLGKNGKWEGWQARASLERTTPHG